MVRRSEPGLGQWLFTTIIVLLALLFIYFLIQYSNSRALMPTGMRIAGVDVGGLDSDQARTQLAKRYLEASVIVSHGDQVVELLPERDAGFQLQLDEMIFEAENKRDNLDYWAGFWGFMWGRPLEVDPIELSANHDRLELIDSLSQLSSIYDKPPQPPQPVPATLSFLYGDSGIETNIEKSLESVEAALYRPVNRNSTLLLEIKEPERPNINLLGSLIVNHMQVFDGVYSAFILDTTKGDEFSVNGDLPMSGISLLKIPIALETMRIFGNPPAPEFLTLIEESLLESGSQATDELLFLIAGEENPCLGPEMVTKTLQDLGLANTYITTPYEANGERCPEFLETEANTQENLNIVPTSNIQITAKDAGTLMLMLYDCAHQNGGTLIAALDGDITQAECEFLLEILAKNRIGSLIEEGVPADTQVAHRHGWISDTHSDAGIVYTDDGDYIIVIMMYKRDWLEWAVSSPLIADISQAAYNYFNFDEPYISN